MSAVLILCALGAGLAGLKISIQFCKEVFEVKRANEVMKGRK